MKNEIEPIYYVVILQPVDSFELTTDVIAKHAQHLHELDVDGKLVLAGPFTDDPSGLLVLRSKSKDEVKSIMEKDPLIQGGYRTFEVKTWLMANFTNNYLPLRRLVPSQQRFFCVRNRYCFDNLLVSKVSLTTKK